MIKVAHSAYFQGGGIGMYTLELLQALALHDEIAPYLICTPEFEWQDIKGVEVRPALLRLSHPLPALRKARFLLAQWWNPFRLLRVAKQENIDIIHLQSFHHLSFVQWQRAAKQSGLKWVISAHDVKRAVPILHRGWEDEQLRAAYRFADAILVHSEFQKQELISFAGLQSEKVKLVPHGPYLYPEPGKDKDALRAELGLPTGAEVVLFFGQVRDDKNLASFLRALAQTDTNIHLIVAGQPGGRHRAARLYQELCVELRVQDRVHFFLRHIPDEEVGQFFKCADWVALPYRTSFTSQSGVLNIAAQFECPVLVSDAPVLKETIEASGIGIACKDDTPEALADGISTMQQQIREGNTFPFEAYCQRYSWEENARITAGVYRELISTSNAVKITY